MRQPIGRIRREGHIVAKQRQTIVRSRIPRNEIGFALCRVRKTGRLVRGPVAEGTSTRVDIPIQCPQGSDFEVLFHTHPGGVAEPSALDRSTARRFRAKALCIASDRELKCHSAE
jgi:proteasome lid subunit RPN8/RPN11